MSSKKKRQDGERGAVLILEAAFVFPIMFIILFAMLMAGNVYYQNSRVERAVMEAAIDGAADCENPMLPEVEKNHAVPTAPGSVDLKPYRYCFALAHAGNIEDLAAQQQIKLKSKVQNLAPIIFRRMEPSNADVTVQYNQKAIISTLEVQCDYDIELPLKLLFTNNNLKFRYSVHAVEPVGDSPEFVRNVHMVQNIVMRSKIGGKVVKAEDQIDKMMDKIGTFTN